MADSTQSSGEVLAQIAAAIIDPALLVRAVASGRRRGESVPWQRVEVRYVELTSGLALQVSTYDGRSTTVQNAATESVEANELVNRLLDIPFHNWRVETVTETIQVHITKKGRARIYVQALDEPRVTNYSHDREKRRMLCADHPVLRAVGITDAAGRVKPSRQGKYRQVDEFLRVLAPTLDGVLKLGRIPRPTASRPIRIVDLGCGSAYLTFAAVAYMLDVRQYSVRMVGVDLRADARHRNIETAAAVGMTEHVAFQTSTIASVELPDRPDVVLSLHACDTATDEALARAVRWRAPLILASPCCHHDIQAQLRRAPSPTPYGMLTRDGILRERFADVLTDAFRAAILRLHGYRVDAIEFVGSQHTPRNTLLRAVQTDTKPTQVVHDQYVELASAWGVQPALQRMLTESTRSVPAPQNE